ncbi:MAG: hypothetical protein IT473_04160 [Lysobacter sp.]|nr:hypothetical protein [Lysobacter sp.]
MRLAVLIGCTLVGCAVAVLAADPASATDPVVAQATALARDKALKAEAVDWATVEREAQALASAEPGEAGRTAAIRYVLKALGDGHSSYRPPQALPSAESPKPAPEKARRPIAESATGARFGRLIVNAWTGPSEAVPAATGVVRDALVQSLAVDRCGLIVDVSSNHGGNMWPMMGGIAPLYDEGTLETFENRAGMRQRVNVRGGVLHMNESAFPRLENLIPLAHKPAYVAIVLGRRTASSGEILALGFKGQRNVRFFGRPTAGATTANASLRLENGGLLALTTSWILDRGDRAHHGPVLPDQETDDAVVTAEAWLAERCR